jgi:hypothetical protein
MSTTDPRPEDTTAFYTDGLRVYVADNDGSCVAFYEPEENGHWVSAENPVNLRDNR